MSRSLSSGMSALGGLLALLLSLLIAESGWAQSSCEQLLPFDGTSDERFGLSVSLSSTGETALVGAYGDDDNGSRSSSAYVPTLIDVPEPTFGWGLGVGVLGLVGMRRGRERAESEGRAK